MGLSSDILESIRENSYYDPCLVLPSSPYASIPCPPVGGFPENCPTEKENFLLAISKQIESRINSQYYGKQYASSLSLINCCVFKQNCLRRLLHLRKFETVEVSDTIREYIDLIEYSIEYARNRLAEAKAHLDVTPPAESDFEELTERNVTLASLLDSLFLYLTTSAITDNSRFVHSFFNDVAFIIQQMSTNQLNKTKSKDICREFYEKNYHPSYGIDTCENCGMKLYKECPYCFNCYERN